MSTRIIFMIISFLLIPSLLFLSVSADVFVSIDCGSSDAKPYTDNHLITWSGDQGYVRTGEPHKVPPNNSLSHVMDTLRVFAANKRNCYLIGSVTKGRVLLRASFYYGNYDGKNEPPSFDLSFDGNYWDMVTTGPDYVYYEVIYVMKKDSISVCVEQKYVGQFPFVSAIEVRALETWMYSYISEEYPLFLKERVAYGANSTIRYIDDWYDRIWTPSGPVKAPLTTITSSPFLNQTYGYGDNPPPRILQNAITPINPNTTLYLSLPLPKTNVSIYLNLYFAEVFENLTRSFQFYIGNTAQYIPISTRKNNVTELYLSNFTASSNTSFSLVPTNDSRLPPLINALELFFVGVALTNGTYSKDVQGLDSIRNAFDALKAWSGDPCLPSPYAWDWINCTSDSTPRVTALLLGGFNLSGKLPNFSSMDALETIDLHNNSLSGPIPDFLGALPKLKNLNLANNNFNDSVPTSLQNNNGLNLVLSGNPELCKPGKPCGSPTSSTDGSIEKNNMLLIMFGVTIQTIFFFPILHVF